MISNEQTELTFNNNKDVIISIGSSRQSKRWKNTQLTIKEFVERLQEPVVTSETLDEYIKLPKDEQDKIKDVGGFVGGTLKNGSRKKYNVANRQMFTFDIDYADAHFITCLDKVLHNYCYTLYSTHKHSRASQRYRVIVYPDRVMTCDEYEAASRYIANAIGIDYFDSASWDINRMMYWPSCSTDGEYVFKHNDKKLIKVDAILGRYKDWRNVTEWSRSTLEGRVIDKKIARQADPLTKKGVVGAFCRVVSIHDAITKYLSDVYKSDGERYTYIDGSSSMGVVIYDDKFAYSNHSTDPAANQLCNAFDLIRIHKFGDLDDEVSDKTPANRKPSYAAMCEFVEGVDGVKLESVKHNMIEDGDFQVLSEESVEWLTELETDQHGNIRNTYNNLYIIVSNDVQIKDKIKHNLFINAITDHSGELWSTQAELSVRTYVCRKYKCDFSDKKLSDALQKLGFDNPYHPVRQFVKNLKWDGVKRAETLLIDYLGCDDNIYTREACYKWLLAAIYRVFEPGFKFDYALILEGKQGVGKSTFLRELACGWFGELHSFDNARAVEEMKGCWVMEIAELSANKKSDREAQLAFLSAKETTVRLAYERHVGVFKRQCVFAGTTNEKEYLQGFTGNRRWWPIVCSDDQINLEKLRSEIKQIWAEMYQAYLNKENIMLSNDALNILADLHLEKTEDDGYFGLIQNWLDEMHDMNADRQDVFDEDWQFYDRVCVPLIADKLFKGSDNKGVRNRIANAMDKMPGWRRKTAIRFKSKYGRQRGWEYIGLTFD